MVFLQRLLENLSLGNKKPMWNPIIYALGPEWNDAWLVFLDHSFKYECNNLHLAVKGRPRINFVDIAETTSSGAPYNLEHNNKYHQMSWLIGMGGCNGECEVLVYGDRYIHWLAMLFGARFVPDSNDKFDSPYSGFISFNRVEGKCKELATLYSNSYFLSVNKLKELLLSNCSEGKALELTQDEFILDAISNVSTSNESTNEYYLICEQGRDSEATRYLYFLYDELAITQS